MPRTRFLSAAYNVGMELLLILLLLSQKENGDMNAALSRLLALWRENRDLVRTLAGAAAAPPPPAPPAQTGNVRKEEAQTKEDCPARDSPDMADTDVLGRYLHSRAAH